MVASGLSAESLPTQSPPNKGLPNESRAEQLARRGAGQVQRYCRRLGRAQAEQLLGDWTFWARPEQLPPSGDWRQWLILAGRGFGKTRAGAEWVRSIACHNPGARIALVAANLIEARQIMVEGESGLLGIARSADRPIWEPSLRRLRWSNGAMAMLYSAAEPESLRGPQFGYAWCDELSKWDNNNGQADAAWDNLAMALRLGERPRVMVTTTPRPVPLLRRVLAPGTDRVVTRGSTMDNRGNLPRIFLEAMTERYGGTLLGRQELMGELVEDIAGALWSRSLLERCRMDNAAAEGAWRRLVIGVDPPASSSGDACGIIVAALDPLGRAVVLADCSVQHASPESWARAVARAARIWKADRVVAEANQGGAMVGSVLHAAEISLPIKLVHASRGKTARAEPVAALYEAGRVAHAGMFAQLEDELCGLITGGDYAGPGRSPDRADALVWALTELMLGQRSEPRIHFWEG